jgi:hypothetical protein
MQEGEEQGRGADETTERMAAGARARGRNWEAYDFFITTLTASLFIVSRSTTNLIWRVA